MWPGGSETDGSSSVWEKSQMLLSPSRLLLHTPQSQRTRCPPAGGGMPGGRGDHRAPSPCGPLVSLSPGCRATCPGRAAQWSSGHLLQDLGTLTSAWRGWSCGRVAAPGRRPLKDSKRTTQDGVRCSGRWDNFLLKAGDGMLQ